QERLANLKVDMDIIERAYRQGLNTSLDVYLTRATVAQERARIAQQQQLLSENKVALQLLLADYPNGQLTVNKTLAVLDEAIPLGLPSELVSRRPDLQQSWMNLMAADAGLAIAHKQRFPRLSLVASGSDVSSEIGSLLNGSTLAWSLLGNLTQPVFNAGRLKALEEQARSRVIQLEKQYLDSLFLAFSEVENAISRNAALAAQYQATLASEKNAVLALTLAFEQYQRGLVTYTTVLESQRRAFDAQSTVIDLRNQLLQNRITLFLALGGDFGSS
ncbi:MAG: multidrug efflux system outer membrane protein, partial [Planctomycetota bacterium]